MGGIYIQEGVLQLRMHRTGQVLFLQVAVNNGTQPASILPDVGQLLLNDDLFLLDLGQLQNIVDQVQQLLGGSIDIF